MQTIKIKNIDKFNNNQIAKRDIILTAALEIFARKGFQKARVNEIARQAVVSEATIYKEFENKEDMLYAIPEKIMPEATLELALHMQGIKGAQNKFRKFLWFYLYFFETNKDWATVVLLQIKPNPRFTQTKAYKLIREFTRIFIDILEEGKKEGTFKKNLDNNLARHIFIGGIEHITTRWLLLGKPEHLLSCTDELFEIFTRAFGPEGTFKSDG